MALIKCEECGNEISKNAESCPKCGHPVRKQAAGCGQAIGGTFILLIIIMLFVKACSSDEIPLTYDAYKDKTLGDILPLSSPDKKEVIADYLLKNNIAASHKDAFYTCLVHFAHTKLETLKVREIVEVWCGGEFNRNNGKFINQYYDLDRLKEQFSGWDGSHRKLEATIKLIMSDPDSYEHVKTNYRLYLTDNDAHIKVSTTFRGKNAFGGTVTNTISAKANIETGDIIEIIE